MKLIAFVSSFFVTSSLLVSSTTPQLENVQPIPEPVPIVQSIPKKVKTVSLSPDMDYIASVIKEKSIEYGVDYAVAMTIVQNESRFYTNVVGDTHLICNAVKSPYYGKPMRSRGLVQINDCWNPDITDEQAFDMMFSIEFLMKNLADGKCSMWSTCPL